MHNLIPETRSDEVRAAYVARLRHVEEKQHRARQRLHGFEMAHQVTGLCPCPRRHRNIALRVSLRARFIRDLLATLDALREAGT